LVNHFEAAARACAPLPFYIYEFAARSGYAVPVAVIEELRLRLPNLAGLKVSDAPWDRFEPYLLDGLDVFVGPEALIHKGIAQGAVGAVSALASSLPELVIDAVRTGEPAASQRCVDARQAIQKFPFPSGLKVILQERGVPITGGVRAPLRAVNAEDQIELKALARSLVAALPVGT
jgi:dihydrodipicolinate synthase/N-acetylneuraminate lyase